MSARVSMRQLSASASNPVEAGLNPLVAQTDDKLVARPLAESGPIAHPRDQLVDRPDGADTLIQTAGALLAGLEPIDGARDDDTREKEGGRYAHTAVEFAV